MEIAGPDAAAALEHLCDNVVARGVGQVTYTQMLNRRGGIECDFTVARLGEELFQIVTGTAFGNHDREWIRKNIPDDAAVSVRDVTSAWSCIGIWGPRARDVLDPLTPASLTNEDFPYMGVREITIGNVPVRALRVTYVGELGWEIYCPTEYGLGLWRTLWAAGEEHGIVAAGYRAIDSMRLEKGYRVWGADITPDETPYEGGVGFCVKLDKDGGFIGREALVEAKEAGPRTKLCCLTLSDPRSVALGNEPVRVGGEIAGRVTTGGYGYTVERSIAYAYLPPRARRGGHGGRGRDLRRVGRRRGREGAALRPEGRANPRVALQRLSSRSGISDSMRSLAITVSPPGDGDPGVRRHLPPSAIPPPIDNPYLPLQQVPPLHAARRRRTASDMRIERTVLDRTRTFIVDGAAVEAMIVKDSATNGFTHGELIEDTHDFFAQDDSGAVRYFGERVDNIRDGRVVNHHGSWIFGRDTADELGVLMAADPHVGSHWRSEVALPITLEHDRVVSPTS